MKHRTLTPDMGAYPSWPLRLAAFRTGDWLGECLLSIRKEAQKAGDDAVYWAAQAALDTGGDLSDLDAIFAAEAEAERHHPEADLVPLSKMPGLRLWMEEHAPRGGA